MPGDGEVAVGGGRGSHPIRRESFILWISFFALGCFIACESSAPLRYDFDGDGSIDGEDCQPEDAAVHPGASDPYGDGLDQDCDGGDGADGDGDGFPSPGSGVSPPQEDCNDHDPAVHPGAVEVSGDGVDQDCDGDDFLDTDGDGTPDEKDCAPQDPHLSQVDGDEDGVTSCDGDCDDQEPLVAPGRVEVCDGLDNDCNGRTDAWDTGNLDCASLRLLGDMPGDWFGRSLDGGVDVSGDGRADLLVGGQHHDEGGEDAGAAWLYTEIIPGVSESAEAVLYGVSAGDRAGTAVALLQDVNGDGQGDVMVGAPERDETGEQAGAVYVFWGPISGEISLAAADVVFGGEGEGDTAGYAVSAGGDINGDGMADVLMGADGNDEGGEDAGAVYLRMGGELASSSLGDGPSILRGPAGSHAGVSVAAAGDVDGDGYDDILVGAFSDAGSGEEAGAVYLVTGPVLGEALLEDVATAIFWGEAAGDEAGWDVSSAGDVDGDGFMDLLISADDADGAGVDEGAVYLLRGPISGVISLADSDARVAGVAAEDRLGYAIAEAGDVNQDGYDDVLLGAYGEDTLGDRTGGAWVLFGPFSGEVDLVSEGVHLVGEAASTNAGNAVAAAGDVNGDGRADLWIAACLQDEAGEDAGAVYLLLGGDGTSL